MGARLANAVVLAVLCVGITADAAFEGDLRLTSSGSSVGDLAVPVILNNATAVFAPTYGPFSATFQAVDSPQDINNFLQGADDFAVSSSPLSLQQYIAANRSVLQIPWAVSSFAVIFNLPGVPTEALILNAQVLSGIYQCTITSWRDPAIVTLNQNLTLPDLKIIPASYSEAKGSTQIFTSYLSTYKGWTGGSATQIPWPRCVQHVWTPDGITDAVKKTPGALRVNASNPMLEAVIQNAAGKRVAPSASFSTMSITLPTRLASPDWVNVSIVKSAQPDVYPIAGILYCIVNQDNSAAGVQEAKLLRDIMAYFISDQVQGNLSFYGLMPIPHTEMAAARREVAQMRVYKNATNSSDASQAQTQTGTSLDGLLSNGTVVEGSGGASIQSLISTLLRNASATSQFGDAGLQFAPTDSMQGKQGVISQSFAYAVSTFPLSSAELSSAARPMAQVPIGFSPIAIIHNVPGIPSGQLRLDPTILARIYQCNITSWNDIAIKQLNPTVLLPNAPILPVGLTDVSGTTALLATYLARSQVWSLGVTSSLAWGRCVRRTIGGSNAVVQAVNATTNAIGYASLNAYDTSRASLPMAAMMNKAMAYVTPEAAIFPFNETEMPSSITSPDWNLLDLNTTAKTDKYPIGGLVYLICNQNLYMIGYPQGAIVQQLIEYFLSDAVQSNLTSQGVVPLLPSFVKSVRQQVADLKVLPGALDTQGGSSVAGSASGSQQQPSASKAGFPWWAGLIIGLVCAVIIGVVVIVALILAHRRRSQRAAGQPLEEVVQAKGKEPGGGYGSLGSDRPPRPPSGGMPLAMKSGDRVPSMDSDQLILVNNHVNGLKHDSSSSSGPRQKQSSLQSMPGMEDRKSVV